MTKDLAGRVALVTGASRGIGRAVASLLSKHGASVAIHYNKNKKEALVTQKVLEGQGASSIIVQGDVSNHNDVKNIVKRTLYELGKIDLLVVNAGIAKAPKDPLEMSYEVWRELMAVNVDGTYLTLKEVIPGMLDGGFGRIVCISSIAGLGARPKLVSYGTSKAAVIALVRNLAPALAPSIRINSVAPGLIETDMILSLNKEDRDGMIANTPLGRIGNPEEIAEAVLYLLSERSSFTTGQTIVADGGREPLP